MFTGRIATYRQEEFNIDMVTPGRALLQVYERDPRPEWKTALAHLRRQLAQQPRTSEGGFWHKLRYPHQMWLDGLYMGSPFLAHYGRVFNEPAAFDEVASHFESSYHLTLAWLPPEESRSRASGLLYENRSTDSVDWRERLQGFIAESDRFMGLLEGVMPEVGWLEGCS